ncbi:VOC family protein [Candidatus Gottesmanbacteria bacterium]|nr:VOC family protein [Candidatus Gottesmanbacteria bacterium]
MNPVVHFEMPAKDKKRVCEFYTKVFGWNMKKLGEDMGNYVLAGTAETDENNMVKTPGAINGGFFDYKDDELNRAPHLVLAVEDLQESMKAVESSGGNTVGEPMDIPNIGRYVSFRDTEGNIVGMLQPRK